SWGETAARFRVGAGWITARLTPGTGTLDVELFGEDGLAPTTVVTVQALGTSRDVPVTPGADAKVQLQGAEPVATAWSDFDSRPAGQTPRPAAPPGPPRPPPPPPTPPRAPRAARPSRSPPPPATTPARQASATPTPPTRTSRRASSTSRRSTSPRTPAHSTSG